MKRSFDLNLLVVFEAIDRERSVTRAADALGLSQPAVSHALMRLRHMLKDQLFVKTAAGMTPTPRAQRMLALVRQNLLGLQSLLEDEPFDPHRASDTFVIAMNNFAAIVLAPTLVARLAAKAPHTKILVRPSGTLDTELLLSRGELDLVVGDAPGLSPDDPGFLLSDRFVAIGRRAPKRRVLTTKSMASAHHLRLSSIGGDDTFVDAALEARGVTRHIVCEVPYLASGAVLEQTDMLAVVPRELALSLCRDHDLTELELPFAAPVVCIGMKWSKLHDTRPSHKWLREELKHLASHGLHAGRMVRESAGKNSKLSAPTRPGKPVAPMRRPRSHE